MKIYQIFFLFLLSNIHLSNKIEKKLEGIPISSDIKNEKISLAFDGDLSTNFISSNDYGWIGKELLYPSKITKIGFYFNVPDINFYLLGIFQGSNDINFFDAVPLYMIINEEKKDEINFVEIKCEQIFK